MTSKQHIYGTSPVVLDSAPLKYIVLGHTTVQERTQLQQRLTLDFNIRSIHARERIHFAELRIWKSSVNNSQFNSLLSNKNIPGQCLTLFLYATQMRRDGTGKDYTFVVSKIKLFSYSVKFLTPLIILNSFTKVTTWYQQMVHS